LLRGCLSFSEQYSDDELIDAASQGKLRDPAVLERQVQRMLKDDRSSALATNFAGQMAAAPERDRRLPQRRVVPQFQRQPSQDFVKETELFFESIGEGKPQRNGSPDGNDTFLNENLAKLWDLKTFTGRLPKSHTHRPEPLWSPGKAASSR